MMTTSSPQQESLHITRPNRTVLSSTICLYLNHRESKLPPLPPHYLCSVVVGLLHHEWTRRPPKPFCCGHHQESTRSPPKTFCCGHHQESTRSPPQPFCCGHQQKGQRQGPGAAPLMPLQLSAGMPRAQQEALRMARQLITWASLRSTCRWQLVGIL